MREANTADAEAVAMGAGFQFAIWVPRKVIRGWNGNRRNVLRRGFCGGNNHMDRSNIQMEKDCSKLPNNEPSTHKFALELCECLIDQYLRWKKENGRKRDIAQSIALIFTAITPVLLLIPLHNEVRDFIDLIAAASAAVATIASGLLVINGWRENYIRYGYTWHTLQIERNRYLTHASKDYSNSNPEEAAMKFAGRIEQIVMAEVSDWRAEMQRIAQQK